MGADMPVWTWALLIGLVIFLSLEAGIVSLILLARVRDLAARVRELRPVEQGPRTQSPPAKAEPTRIEVALVAPELVDAVRGLRVGGDRPARPVFGPGQSEAVAQGAGRTAAPVRNRELQTKEFQRRTAVISLILVSRSGGREDKRTIGQLRTVSGGQNEEYQLTVEAVLERKLVLEVARRVELETHLRRELQAQGNNEDPLGLLLDLGVRKPNLPALRDPEVEEIEFSVDLVAPTQSATLSMDRTVPVTVVIKDFSEIWRTM